MKLDRKRSFGYLINAIVVITTLSLAVIWSGSGAVMWLFFAVGTYSGILCIRSKYAIGVLLGAGIGGSIGLVLGVSILVLLTPPEYWLLDPLAVLIFFGFPGLCFGIILGLE